MQYNTLVLHKEGRQIFKTKFSAFKDTLYETIPKDRSKFSSSLAKLINESISVNSNYTSMIEVS